jgi:hypothetical protein
MRPSDLSIHVDAIGTGLWYFCWTYGHCATRTGHEMPARATLIPAPLKIPVMSVTAAGYSEYGTLFVHPALPFALPSHL